MWSAEFNSQEAPRQLYDTHLFSAKHSIWHSSQFGVGIFRMRWPFKAFPAKWWRKSKILQWSFKRREDQGRCKKYRPNLQGSTRADARCLFIRKTTALWLARVLLACKSKTIMRKSSRMRVTKLRFAEQYRRRAKKYVLLEMRSCCKLNTHRLQLSPPEKV